MLSNIRRLERTAFLLTLNKYFDMLGLDDLFSKMSLIIPITQQGVERIIAHIY